MSNQKIQSALDAAGTAADYSARATYQRGYDAGVASLASQRDAAIARAEAAEARLVQGCSGCVSDPVCRQCSDASTAEHLRSLVAAAERRESETMRGLDAAIARAEKAEEDLRCFLRGEPSASSMISGLLSRVIAAESRADAAEAREWALGVQVVAQQERLKVAGGLAVAVREWFADGATVILFDALAAYHAVQGDDKETT